RIGGCWSSTLATTAQVKIYGIEQRLVCCAVRTIVPALRLALVGQPEPSIMTPMALTRPRRKPPTPNFEKLLHPAKSQTPFASDQLNRIPNSHSALILVFLSQLPR